MLVNNLPIDGRAIYVRLWTFNNGWTYKDYTYFSFSGRNAAIRYPIPGSNLSSNSANFTWNRPNGAIDFDLIIGTNGPGSSNVRSSSVFNNTNMQVTNLPADGRTIYVRLWTYNNGWQYRDYTYNTNALSSFTEDKGSLVIFPVPVTKENLYISHQEDAIIRKISIRDIHGNILFNSELSSKKMNVDISNFKPGLYIITAEDDNNVYKKTITIE